MVRRWTELEFRTVLGAPRLSDEDLAGALPNWAPGAVEVVRAGVHDFYLAGRSGILSQMMRRVLEGSRGQVACPVCGGRI